MNKDEQRNGPMSARENGWTRSGMTFAACPASLWLRLQTGSEAMFGHGKCPQCQQQVTQGDLHQLPVGNHHEGQVLQGMSICCPKCHTVLGVMADPAAMVADIVAQVTAALRKTG
jgi:hypothetical protein